MEYIVTISKARDGVNDYIQILNTDAVSVNVVVVGKVVVMRHVAGVDPAFQAAADAAELDTIEHRLVRRKKRRAGRG